MATKTIKQSVDIAAPRERVWDVLLKDETFRQWAAEFMEGSYAETDWQLGSKAAFLDPAGNGMIGRIVASDRPELLEISYDGQVVTGKEDFDSPEAQQFKGAREAYRLTERSGKTRLDIEADMAETYYADMSEAWVRALAKVKELAEAG